ncbi:MAG TPA: DUF1194 domain-containing protein [Hyphomicrobium sp.]|nr:DUF1194 domain-containing protein [Hyphomicrobium sp.]
MSWHRWVIVVAGLIAVCAAHVARGADDAVDTALVIAVDVSQSVDATRYKLQMDGIAAAFEDKDVIAAITSGANGRILITLVTWSDTASIAIPWTLIANAGDALAVARAIRVLPQATGEFTCLARMLRTLQRFSLAQIPLPANRTVVDVSGDGIDNCDDTPATGIERDQIVAAGGVINGLPVIVAGENDEIVGSGAYRKPGYDINNLSPDKDTTTLDAWYKKHVLGGRGAFIMPAKGYEDFGRAFRQKFVTEVSTAAPALRRTAAEIAKQ